MATLLNRKIGYLTLVPQTITTTELKDQNVTNAKVKDRDLEFLKTNDSFAAALLDTTKRVVYPFIGGDKKSLPAASSMDVSVDFAGVSASIAAPVYDATARTWSNLGAIVYNPENKVLLRAPGAGGPDSTDSVRDSQGREVYGRLTKSGEVWTVSFYIDDNGTETAHTFAAPLEAYLIYKHWVPGSSSMLEDQGKTIVTAPGAVDISEANNIDQLAKDLGVTLTNNGAMSLSESVITRLNKHVTAVAERHNTSDIDAHADVNIAGFADGGLLTGALNQLESNINSAAAAALANLRQYFNELRSNGVLGTASVVSVGAGLQVAVAAHTAYVGGRRWEVAAQNVTVPASATTKLWVDLNGDIQTGASYPADLDTVARLGSATADATNVTSVTDEHRALLELDQKVYDVEALLNAHIGSTTAHAAANITFNNTTSQLKNADESNVTQVQQAIDALQRRLNNIRFKEHVEVLTQAQIDGATVDGALKYIVITLPNGDTYEVGQNMLEVNVDGDIQELGRVYTEPNNTSIRLYFDPAEPLVEDQRVHLRWLAV